MKIDAQSYARTIIRHGDVMGMAADSNVSILNWQNQPIRIIKEQDAAYIPIGDIALAIGMEKRPLQRLLDRNKGEFLSHERDVQMDTPGGKQHTRCLDYSGTLGVLFKISTNHLKDDATRERLLDFRQYMIENKIQTTLPALPALPEPDQGKQIPDWISTVMQHLEFAELFATQTGADLPMARIFAMDAAGKEVGKNLSVYKHLIPGIVSQETGYLTPSQIADRITRPGGREMTGFNVNKYLENHGYQLRDEKSEWQPTEKGKPFAKVIPVMKGSWTGTQVLWHEIIIVESKMG